MTLVPFCASPPVRWTLSPQPITVDGTKVFPGHSVPHPDAAIYYCLEKSWHVLGCFQCLRTTGVPPVKVCQQWIVAGFYVQETCCGRFSTAPSIRGISTACLAVTFRAFFSHTGCWSKPVSLGTARLESLLSSAVHAETIPCLPQGQPLLCPCPSAPWLLQSPCRMVLGAELPLVLSLQAPGPPGYDQDGAQACICIQAAGEEEEEEAAECR